MARRNRNHEGQLDRLLLRVQRRFQGTPLSAIGDTLVGLITGVQGSFQAGSASVKGCDAIAHYVDAALECLPQNFGERFTFDAQLIRNLADEYSQGAARLSGIIVPIPSKTWGHQTVSLPASKGQAFPIDLIHVPGDDNVDDIDLLDYPFVCHELGHNILFHDQKHFINAFQGHLDAALTSIQRQSIGIHGSSKAVSDSTTEAVRQYWTPTANQYNWAHEIAVDVIATWLIGPAYLAALQDVMEAKNLDPYQLGQSHPPYQVRGAALIETAERLGWAYYSGPTVSVLEKWSSPALRAKKSNLHVACSDSRLVSGAISAALETCTALFLPRCTPDRIAALGSGEDHGHPLELGTDTILRAWLVHSKVAETEYEEWERATIKRALADLTE